MLTSTRTIISVVFAVLAAIASGMSLLTQHQANVSLDHSDALTSEGHVSRLHRGLDLLRDPIWLIGTVFLSLTFVLGAMALYFGQLVVVQPIFVLELVVTLLLRRLWLHDRIATKTWLAAAVLCVGLTGFLVTANPQDTSNGTSALRWTTVVLAWSAIVCVLLLIARRGSDVRRAAMYGAAASVVWSIDAAFVKAATLVLKATGWSGMFVHWPLYALVATGILGELMVQSALHAGPLSASQPAMLIVEPLAGILVGIQVFGEHLRSSPLAISGEILFLATMVLGVLFITRWAPPRLSPRVMTSKS